MRAIVIACARPGLIRAGVRHPAVASHALDAFTPEQLRELLAEPALRVVIGEALSEAFIRALEDAPPPAPGKKR